MDLKDQLAYAQAWTSDFRPPFTRKEARPQREVAEYVAGMLSLADATTAEVRGVALSLLQTYDEHVPASISQGTREHAMTFAHACGTIEAAGRSLLRIIRLSAAELLDTAGLRAELPEEAERPTPEPLKGTPAFALTTGAALVGSNAETLREVFHLLDLCLLAAYNPEQTRRPIGEYGPELRTLCLAEVPLSIIEAAAADLSGVLAPPQPDEAP